MCIQQMEGGTSGSDADSHVRVPAFSQDKKVEKGGEGGPDSLAM